MEQISLVYNMKNGAVENYSLCEQENTKNTLTLQCKNGYIHNRVTYNKITKKLIASTDIFSGLYFIYYTVTKDKLYLSTSLKFVLAQSNLNRRINFKAADRFFDNGIILGKETLIVDVYKIEPGHDLGVNFDLVTQKIRKTKFMQIKKSDAKSNWHKLLHKSIDKSVSNIDNVGISLSTGYDSNYILNYLTRQKKQISIFSIGGTVGRSEIDSVKGIMKYYPNLTCQTSLVDHKIFQNLPDIVWRLDGALYEGGIFLQYALGKLLEKNGIKHLICGEGADQIFNERFYEKQARKLIYSCKTHPKEMLMYCILKKSSILLNSFGIKGEYPYLSERILSVGYVLRKENGINKAFHKEQCRRTIPYGALLKKRGGSTHNAALFDNKKTHFEQLLYLIKLMGKYKPSVSTLIFQILYILVETGFQKMNPNDEKIPYFILAFEKFRDFCLKRIYINVFEKLFINRHTNFNLTHVDISLDDLLS